jgi:Uma2 family endonuclease
MSGLTIELPRAEAQAETNLRRWEEVLADPALKRLDGRIETDRYGRIIMSPPPAPRHGRYQGKITSLLSKLLPHGETIPECPISTADGVRAADVAWASQEQWRALGNRACFLQAPEICLEVISPGNREEEIEEKTALYFDAGAKEVWTCGAFGKMTFFAGVSSAIARSKICPDFPGEV